MAYRYPTVKVAGKTKLLHRHLVEQRLGRTLLPHEHVHHRNEDRFDRSDDNLVVLPDVEHRQLHAEQRLKYPREKVCLVCGTSFVPHATKRKRQITCSPACANIQRGRSERQTKSKARGPDVAAALVRANVGARQVRSRSRAERDAPLFADAGMIPGVAAE